MNVEGNCQGLKTGRLEEIFSKIQINVCNLGSSAFIGLQFSYTTNITLHRILNVHYHNANHFDAPQGNMLICKGIL